MSSQRRLAAEIMKVGTHRVWIDPEESDKVESAITREEIRKLIHEGVIQKTPVNSISRGRHRLLSEKRRAGRRSGPGSKKGSPGIGKKGWVKRIRVIRSRLRHLRDKRMIAPAAYRKLFMMAKGGAFRNRSHLEEYIEAHKLARRR